MERPLPPRQLHWPGQNGSAQRPRPFATHPAPADPRDPPADAEASASHGGPPLLFDEDKRRQSCRLLRHGLAKGAAERLLGVTPRTVRLAVKCDPELADRVRQARLECHSHAAAQIARAGEKNWRAAAWILDQGKRRRGPGRPRKATLPLSDPVARDQMKQLVRNVLLEVMPELRHEITGKRNAASPLAQAASAAVDAYTADRKTRLSALAAEAKATRQRGGAVDFDALWEKHLPGVPRHISPSPSASPTLPRNNTHSNAQQFPSPFVQPSSETNIPHQLASNATAAATSVIAQNR